MVLKPQLRPNSCVASLFKMFIRLWRAHIQIIIEAKTGGWALPLRFRLNAFKDYQARIFMHTPHVIITPHPKDGKPLRRVTLVRIEISQVKLKYGEERGTA